jgi:hypothetical protein
VLIVGLADQHEPGLLQDATTGRAVQRGMRDDLLDLRDLARPGNEFLNSVSGIAAPPAGRDDCIADLDDACVDEATADLPDDHVVGHAKHK